MHLCWTDIGVFITLIILAGNGIYQGCLRSSVGPISFVAGSMIGYAAYHATHRPLVGILVAIWGPVILTWGINLLIRAKFGKRPTSIHPASRIAGALINMLWGGSILALSLILISMLPFRLAGLNAVKKDINASFTYRRIEAMLPVQHVAPPNAKKCATNACALASESDAIDLLADKDVQDLMNDPCVKNILASPELKKALEEKNVGAILSSSEFMTYCQNPKLIVKALTAYPKIQQKIRQPE